MCEHHIECLTTRDHVSHGMLMITNPARYISFRCPLSHVAFSYEPEIDVRLL